MTKTVNAYAKINLLLSVGDIRPDGKHDVLTVINEVSGLYDDVKVTIKNTPEILVSCDNPTVPCDDGNIAFKAAKMYLEHFSLKLGADIQIKKRIPITGGMGGGSTDAAAVLKVLRELCGRGTLSDIASLAAKLGSDVPFFLYGERTMFCTGTGELAASCSDLPHGLYGVFVTHGIKESTGRAYTLLDENYPTGKRINDNKNRDKKLLTALKIGDTDTIFDAISNDFEHISSHYDDVSRELYLNGANKTLLCGSGPTVCGIFEHKTGAMLCSENLKYKNFVCEI